MCPSYMATRNEMDTTRARANILRHNLTNPQNPAAPFANEEIKEVMDLCLSCKGCKSECPSNVDIAKLKGEFLQQYQDAHGVPLRSYMIALFAEASTLASLAPWAWNLVFGTPWVRRLANRCVGFHPERSIPLLGKTTFKKWFAKRKSNASQFHSQVYLFCDEFTNFNDASLGIAAVELLEHLGYEVVIPSHVQSGRASLSKGLLRRARGFATKNVEALHPLITEKTPLIGLEPSAILTFRDEYPDLLRGNLQTKARELGSHCLMVEDFLAREMDAGRIRTTSFDQSAKTVHLHGHCHQKALGSLTPTVRILEQLSGCEVRIIPSGCCGMAGSFGYEAEHFELSQKVAELVLFPAIRKVSDKDLIAAAGTSCRHQIKDGIHRQALHPIQILRSAIVP